MNIYEYNSISVNTYSQEDSGSITSSVDSSIDYNSGSNSLPAQPVPNYSTNNFINGNYEDFGWTYNSSTITPFGSILKQESSSNTILKEYVGSGDITLSGKQTSPSVKIWAGNGTVFEIGGGLERTVRPYVSSGTLRIDSSAATTALEKHTKSYNLSSIYNPILDYGSLFDDIQVIEDYGLITSNHIPGNFLDDFGSILSQPQPSSYPVIPFGSSTLSGSAEEIFSAQIPEETQLFSISGTYNDLKYTGAWVGSGTLFTVSGAVEKVTTNPPENTQLFSISGTALEAYSAQTPENIQLFSISGTALEAYSAQTPEDTLSLYFDGNASCREIAVYQDIITSGLVTISGTNTQNIQVYVPVITGTGTLFSIGTLIESISYSYNRDSVFDFAYLSLNNLQSSDYGPLSGQPTHPTNDFYDYGSITENDTGSVDDAGSITETSAPSIPFGSINVVNGFSPQDTEAYPGGPGVGKSWSFSITGYTGDVPIYTLSGIASCREIAVYQDIVTSGLFAITNTSIIHPFVDYTPHYGIEKNIGIGTTGIQISGSLVEKNTESYVGVGSEAFSGIALEAYSAQTPENTQLFSISGISTESITSNPPENTQLFSISGELLHPFIDYTPHYGIEKNIGIGTTGIQISGTLVERFVKDADESTQLFSISGIAIEKDVDSYVGIETILVSGTALEAFSAQIPEDTQLFSISGTALEAFSAQTPEDTQLFSISGVSSTREIQVYGINPGDHLYPRPIDQSGGNIVITNTSIIHPFVDYTPHYGIEKNIGIGTTGIQISGSLVERSAESYVGVGSAAFSGTALKSFSAQTPEDTQLFSISGIANISKTLNPPENTPILVFSGELLHPKIDYTPHYGIEKNIGIGTTGIKFGVGVGTAPDGDGNPRDAKTYSNRYGFQIGDFNLGSGIGTIRILSQAITKLLIPYKGQGPFIVASGFSPQDTEAYPGGPGVGKSWSFTRATYITSGVTTISGISSDREIQVYGYYGNDKNPGTSGNIFINQVLPTIIVRANSYFTSGNISIGSNALILRKRSFDGSGIISVESTSTNVYSANTPENTVLYSFSGTALESYSSDISEDFVLYTFSSGITSERKTKSYESAGSISFSGQSSAFFVPNYPGSGNIVFISRTVDHTYDTCDNVIVTCDDQDSADVSFVANPPENTQLFTISGNAITSEIATYTFTGIGTHVISGGYANIKVISGAGENTALFDFSGQSSNSRTKVYVGFGNLFTIDGVSQSFGAKIPSDTVLYKISGNGIVEYKKVYTKVGIGLFDTFGDASTRKINGYSISGIGAINVSGQLIHPNIKFIPAIKGLSIFNIVGASDNNTTRPATGFGSFFTLSSGKQSFTYSLYTGIGTMYTISIDAISINNPYQIPRTYTVII